MITDPTTEVTTKPHEITRKLIQEPIEIYYNPEQKCGTREIDIYFAAEQIQPEERLMRVHIQMENPEDSETSCDDLKTQLMYIINEEIRPYWTTEENIEVQFK
jgi:peptide deformylase